MKLCLTHLGLIAHLLTDDGGGESGRWRKKNFVGRSRAEKRRCFWLSAAVALMWIFKIYEAEKEKHGSRHQSKRSANSINHETQPEIKTHFSGKIKVIADKTKPTIMRDLRLGWIYPRKSAKSFCKKGGKAIKGRARQNCSRDNFQTWHLFAICNLATRLTGAWYELIVSFISDTLFFPSIQGCQTSQHIKFAKYIMT